MHDWQKVRNYRKYKNGKDGSATYVITVDGQDVEISREIYTAYSQTDRRERYCSERDGGRLLSLDLMINESASFPGCTVRHTESAEDTAVREMQIRQLAYALESLTDDERLLMEDLFFNSISVREIAQAKGVCHGTIAYRRNKIMEKVLRLMEK